MAKIGGMFNKEKAQAEAKTTTGIQVYDNNSAIIDFFIFFTLFLSASFFGLGKYIKEGGSAARGMAIAIGAALAIAAVKAGMGPTFFIPFVKNIFLFIATIVVFLVLVEVFKMHKGLAFFLAPIIVIFLFLFSGWVSDGKFGTNILGGVTKDENAANDCFAKLKALDKQINEKTREFEEIMTIFTQEGFIPKKLLPENITKLTIIDLEGQINKKYPPTKVTQNKKTTTKPNEKAKVMQSYLKNLDAIVNGGTTIPLLGINIGTSKGLKAMLEEKRILQEECNSISTTTTTTPIQEGDCNITQNVPATNCKCQGIIRQTGYCCKGTWKETVTKEQDCTTTPTTTSTETDMLKEALRVVEKMNNEQKTTAP
jgi:hypothetical protein